MRSLVRAARYAIIGIAVLLTSPVGADGMTDEPVKPIAKKKKKLEKKKRPRIQAPDFDVTETAAWKYGQLTKDECLAEVKTRNLPWTAEDTDGVLAGGRITGPIRGITYRTRLSEERRATSPWEIADCRLVLALDDLAEVLAAHDVVEVRHYSMYRLVPKSWPAGKVGSQHHGAMAIDAAIFTMKDGSKIDVLDDWHGRIGAKTCGPDARPRKVTEKSTKLRAMLCDIAAKRIFNVILTPNHDRAHRNHFHLDVTPGAKWFVVD